MRIRSYEQADRELWDDFVRKAKNRHFFFLRDYMEYHKERFEEASVLVFDEKERLLAILPLTKHAETAVSHGGLTFGGFLVGERMSVEAMVDLFGEVCSFLGAHGMTTLLYKCMPWIYHRYPAEEDMSALFVHGARLGRRDGSSTVLLSERYGYRKGRACEVKKGYRSGITLQESHDYAVFIDLLREVLRERHDAVPVHTAKELNLLSGRFPDNIKLYAAQKDGAMLAGTVIFDNGATVHTQYLMNTARGRTTGALDALIDHLLTEVYGDRRYFDFGISNEDGGRYLNRGLAAQKEGFGARAVVHDFYEVDCH
ncbi:GNAT family N-acetyltransferase [uncultured Selenomonas sp.]|uniref:GNAT family N-acetyltransferase n=1 Tax=uncultured Selenomonas sp. TaxID=159275 RepID=UPI0028DC9A3E|nr:GNAT family N-acetyltransferase [uncultured Selenomonas sp.]